MKIIISESQFLKLKENQKELLGMFEQSYLTLLCKKTSRMQNSPACRLLELKNSLSSDNLKNDLEKSVGVLYNFFKRRTVGIFPKILELSLEYPDRTINFLKLIADFISNPQFDNDETKKRLLRLKNINTTPDDVEELLTKVREKEYSQYEKEFEGDYFKLTRTKLSLNYKCGDEIDQSFLEKVENFKGTGGRDFKNLLNKIKSCILESLNNPRVIKSDVKSSKPLYVIEEDQKVEVFPAGSNFEIKKMDAEIDSYLSEFFSIFKNKDLSHLKPTHLSLYNTVIYGIYMWIERAGKKYLNNLKSNLAGIIFENYLIVPTKYIEFYWSNLGQRGCKELRLSIRFRIKPEYNGQKIETYIFNRESDVLEKKDYTVSSENVTYKVC
jgi:hypothetical protein